MIEPATGQHQVASSPAADQRAAASSSAWSPLRTATFRALWLAQLASMVGTWMQTVGAQWLLIDEPNAPTLVSLVQTASLLPMLLLALPAGVLADAFDRRQLLVTVQLFTVSVGVALTAVTVFSDITPPVLLGLTFLLGCGQAMGLPPWQALIPDIVPREAVGPAAALHAVAVNLARVIGPALAGLLITQLDVGAVFALNTVFFALLALALLRWAPTGRASGDAPERFVPALRAGARYVRNSRVTRRLLLRSALFILPGSAMWALLPVVANEQLRLGSGGYGVLLGALGVGAVAGAVGLSHASNRLSTTGLVLAGSFVFAAAQVGVVLVGNVQWAVLLLLPAGAAWLAVLSSLYGMLQVFLPAWVRARALSIAQIVFMGGQAVGALLWGVVADWASLVPVFVAAGGLMAIGAATLAIWPPYDVSRLNTTPTVYWPEPQLIGTAEPDDGPVLITVTFTVSPENRDRFLAVMERVQGSRRRSGATRWSLYRDTTDPDRYVEVFLVQSWDEHLRQHHERRTDIDLAIDAEARTLSSRPPEVQHLLSARPFRSRAFKRRQVVR